MPEDDRAHPAVAGFPVVLRLPVQWGEMDAYGHLNNTVFFRFFESARVEYLARCGFLEAYERDGIGAILHSTNCRFRRALVYPDTVQVATRASGIEEDRFAMEYVLVSEAAGAVAAEGTGIVVAYDYRADRKTALPDRIRHLIREIEGW